MIVMKLLFATGIAVLILGIWTFIEETYFGSEWQR